MTLKEATTKFIRWGRNYYADRTLVVYAGYIAKFSDFSKNKEIKKISLFNDILRYAEAMRRSGVADNTINLTMIALRQLWRFLENATEEKLPFGREAIPVKRGIRAKSHSPILEEDLRRLVGAIDNTPQGIRDYAIIMLLYATGVRVSELTALDVSDVDLNSQTIVVITRKRKDLVKRRQVPYTNETQLALVNWLSHKKRIGGNPALFLNFKDGGRLTVRSVQRIIKDYCRRSGLDNVRISPHSFRHGLGMRCAESQMYPPYLQDLLGHTNLNSSKVYYNLKNPSLIKEYHERVGDSSIAKFLTTVNEKNKLGENVKK